MTEQPAPDDYEKRVRRAHKLARQYGLRLSERRADGGLGSFWLLGPPRTFEDCEYELECREQAECERETAHETRRITSQEFRKKLDQRWANRPIHPHPPSDQPTVTPADFSKLRDRLERHGRRRPRTVEPPEED
jgi:hypothetical protein